jgi:hypothetical protein
VTKPLGIVHVTLDMQRPCYKQIEDAFLIGCGTSLAIMTMIRSVHSALRVDHARRRTLAAGSICLAITNTLYSMNLGFIRYANANTFLEVAVAIMTCTYITHAFLVTVSFERYFILYPEKSRQQLELITKLLAFAILMFVQADGVSRLLNTKRAQQPGFVISQLIFIIPLLHMIFGVIAFIKQAKSNYSVSAIVSVQPIITMVIILIWISWIGTVLTGNWGAGSSCFLVALAFSLESSIASISQSVQQIGQAVSSLQSRSVGSSNRTVKRNK